MIRIAQGFLYGFIGINDRYLKKRFKSDYRVSYLSEMSREMSSGILWLCFNLVNNRFLILHDWSDDYWLFDGDYDFPTLYNSTTNLVNARIHKFN